MVRAGVYPVGGTRASVSAKTYTLDDFEINSTGTSKSLVADGNYESVYELDIEDGLGEMFGRGNSSNPLQAQGFIGVRFTDGTDAASGKVRLAVRNAQGRRLYNLYEADLGTTDLFTGAVGSSSLEDRRDREPFPVTQGAFETEPHIISIDLDVTADITVEDTDDETAMQADGFRAEALE